MKDYHINIFWSDDDEGYIADIPDLMYCSAFGATPERRSRIEAANDDGTPPQYRPAIYQPVA